MIKYPDCLVYFLLHCSLTDYIHQRKWLITQKLITSHLEFAYHFEHKRYVLCNEKASTFNLRSKSIKTTKWRAIVLKCDCDNLMLLEISMCLVVWSNNYGIRLHQIILCLEDLFQAEDVLLYLRWTYFYSFQTKKENHHCTSNWFGSFYGFRNKNVLNYCGETLSQFCSLGKRTSGVCPLNRSRRSARRYSFFLGHLWCIMIYVGQNNTFHVLDGNGILYCSQVSLGSHRRVIQGICWSGGLIRWLCL